MRRFYGIALGGLIVLGSGCQAHTHQRAPKDRLLMGRILIQFGSEASTSDCPSGGVVVERGIDKDDDGYLDSDEVEKPYVLCQNTVDAAEGVAPQSDIRSALRNLVRRVSQLEAQVHTMTSVGALSVPRNPPDPATKSVPRGMILNERTQNLYSDFRSAVNGARNGDRLLVGKGEFRIDSMIDVINKQGLQFIGSGADNTKIISSDMASVVMGIQHSADIVVAGMLLTHTEPNSGGCEYGVILLNGNRNITIRDNTLRGSGLWGIDSDSTRGALIITDNIIEENTRDGVIFRGAHPELKHLTFTRNIVRQNLGYAFLCDQGCSFSDGFELTASDNQLQANQKGVFSPGFADDFMVPMKKSWGID